MHEATLRAGEESVDALLASRRLDWTSCGRSVYTERVFQALGAVVYAMGWTSDDGEPEFQNAEAWRMLRIPSVLTSTWITISAELCFLSTMGSPPAQSSG